MFSMNFTPSLMPISATGFGHNLGGVERNSQSSTYGENPASAALENGAAFFIMSGSHSGQKQIQILYDYEQNKTI